MRSKDCKTACLRSTIAFFAFLPVLAVHAAPKSSAAMPFAASNGAKATEVPALRGDRNIDSVAVRKKYMDGDFEEAIMMLEGALKEKPGLSHNDSVFIFKHLGVMYAARYETREKGKYYMHQLLMTEPTAKIMDMYASDMIYMIFKNIQDEFESNRMRLNHAEQLLLGTSQKGSDGKNGAGQNDRENNGGPKVKSSGGSAVYWWVGGFALAAGIGGGYYLYSQSVEPTKDKEIVAR